MVIIRRCKIARLLVNSQEGIQRGSPMGKQLCSYIGIIPSEHFGGGRRQRLGKLSKQGNALVRFLRCEALIRAVRRDPELKRFYRRKLIQQELGKSEGRVASSTKWRSGSRK
jgi:transposase